ncbi:MAG: hypothetical protein QXK06_03960 [Candidatus Diapherotrites archaeon]
MVGEEKEKQPYGYEVYEEYEWKAFAKKIAKYLLILVVILAIGWLIYDYFVGSYVPVTIIVQDLEKKPITDNTIYVTNEKTGASHFEKSGQSTYNFTLKRGLFGATENYVVRVEADKFKAQQAILPVGTEKLSQNISLERDIDVKIIDVEIPKQLFGGQTFTMTATIENRGSSGEKIDLGFSKDFEEWSCAPVDKEIFIQAKTKSEFDIQCTVPPTATKSISSKGVEKEAAVYVRLTKQQWTGKFQLYPMPAFSPAARLDFSSMDPIKSPKKKMDFTLKNSSRFPIYDIQLKIEIISAEKNKPEDIKKWVYFVNAPEEDKTKITVPAIRESESFIVPVEVSLPVSALPEKITGRIVIEAPFLTAPMNSTLSIEITKAAQATIRLGYYPQSVSIEFKDGSPEKRQISIDVENSGDLDISNLNIRVKNTDVCTENWLYFTDTGFITKLAAKGKKQVYLTATAPKTAKVDDYAPCLLMASYPHPITGSMMEEDLGLIQVKRSR